MKIGTCFLCLYSSPLFTLNKNKDNNFECRKNAPRKICGVGVDCDERLFPTVAENDWCGEFEINSNKWKRCNGCESFVPLDEVWCSSCGGR